MTVRLVVTTSLGVLLSCAAFSQSAAAPPAFEVASVRPRGTRAIIGSNRTRESNESVRYIGHPVFLLLLRAYGLRPYQVIGPSWIKEERYDVWAKLPKGATAADIPRMLQQLLVERFQLVVHREIREMYVYAITVGKNGPTLERCEPAPEHGPPAELAPGADGSSSGRQKPPPGICPVNRSFASRQTSIRVEVNTLGDLAHYLGGGSDRPVVDRTGIDGHYSIFLEGAQLRDIPPDPTEGSVGLPSLFREIRKLGLELEGRREQIECLVVDGGNRVPTEN